MCFCFSKITPNPFLGFKLYSLLSLMFNYFLCFSLQLSREMMTRGKEVLYCEKSLSLSCHLTLISVNGLQFLYSVMVCTSKQLFFSQVLEYYYGVAFLRNSAVCLSLSSFFANNLPGTPLTLNFVDSTF